MFGGRLVFKILLVSFVATPALAVPGQYLKGTIVHTLWAMSQWSCCDANDFADLGVQISIPACQRSDGKSMTDAECPGVKPVTISRSCSARFCSGYTFQVRLFEPIPNVLTQCASGAVSNVTSLLGAILSLGAQAYKCQ